MFHVLNRHFVCQIVPPRLAASTLAIGPWDKVIQMMRKEMQIRPLSHTRYPACLLGLPSLPPSSPSSHSNLRPPFLPLRHCSLVGGPVQPQHLLGIMSLRMRLRLRMRHLWC